MISIKTCVLLSICLLHENKEGQEQSPAEQLLSLVTGHCYHKWGLSKGYLLSVLGFRSWAYQVLHITYIFENAQLVKNLKDIVLLTMLQNSYQDRLKNNYKLKKNNLYSNFMPSCSTKLLVTHTEEVVRDCILNELHALVGEKYTGKKLMVKLINIHYSMPFN